MKLIEYINNKIETIRWKLRELKEQNYRIEKYRHSIYLSYGWKPTKGEARRHIELIDRLPKTCAGHYIMPIIQH